MYKTLLIFALNLFTFSLFSQSIIPCHTDENEEEYLQAHPELRAEFENAKDELFSNAEKLLKSSAETESVVKTIPVVFHVIYNSPIDNIGVAQIEDAMRILNEDFRRLNPDASNLRPIFNTRAADPEVEFALARIDENGNCTDGITRMQSSLSVEALPRNDVKKLVQWDPTRYLNVWVVNSIANTSGGSGLVLGYANFPWMAASTDGVVIRHDALGLVGTAAYDGRTLTHEVGHYLGLLHTFQGGCNGGDGVADTPPVASANYGCNFNANSCSESPNFPDMIENFMDYSDGACQNTYTNGQSAVMNSAMTTFNLRKDLWTNANLISTGVINPPDCTPTAKFDISDQVICVGDPVQFTDESEDGVPSNYLWDLPGSNVGTSTDPNPLVTYNSPGKYAVTLTVGNTAGSTSVTNVYAVTVKPSWTHFQAEWKEDFEEPTLNVKDMDFFSTYDDVMFESSNAASSSGAQSLFLNNFDAVEPNDIDYFISPMVSTLFANDISLNFDFAYAPRQGVEFDRLRVLVSTDCGKNWTVLRSYAAFALRTASPSLVPFVPSSPSEWKSVSIDISSFEDKGPVLFKFEFAGDGGNNFYLDNINVKSANVGIKEMQLAESIQLFPNPAKNAVNLSFELESNKDFELSLTDVNGKMVRSQRVSYNTKEYTMNLNDVAAGVYLLSIKIGDQKVTKKLIIE